MKKNILIIFSAVIIVLIAAPNAQAYFLELPRVFQDALANKTFGNRVAQNIEQAPVVSQPMPPTTESAPKPMMDPRPMISPAQPPSQSSGSSSGSTSEPKSFVAPAPMQSDDFGKREFNNQDRQLESGKQEFNNQNNQNGQPSQSGSSGGQGSSTQTCNINGVEVPGRCEDLEKNGQQGPGQQGQSEEEMEKRQKEQEQRQKQDMKRGAQQMQMGLRNFESMIKQFTKQGGVIPQEIQDKMAKLKSIVEAVKSAQTVEEIQELGFDEMHEKMQDMEEFRQDFMEKELRMRDIKRNLRNTEQSLKMFERQLTQLEKQKTAIPSEVKETLNKVKTILGAVKAAKSWEEMEAAGIEDLQDLMQTLDENRQSLEMLARWPQTLKQMDRELKRLTSELKRAKLIVDRLLKKEIDLSSVYAEFETAVNKLKSVKDGAVAKMQAGEGEEAFDLVQNDFFGQMEDVWQSHKIIMTMSNLGRFASDFKRGIADGQRMLKQLKRQKIDTTELEALLDQVKTKGEEILALLKTPPIDEEAIMAGLQEMENLRQEFENTVAELTGKEEAMPWELGPQIFKTNPELPSNVQKFFPKKVEQPKEELKPTPGETVGESNPSPAP